MLSLISHRTSPRAAFFTRFALCACVVFASILAFTLDARAQDGTDDVIDFQTNLVQLNVGVADRQGRPIMTLSGNDFVIYEDDVKQTVTSFATTDAPFSLVLLLDMSGSTTSFRTTLKQAALRFIDALAPEDRICLIAFNDKTKLLAKFTIDRRKIAEEISLASGGGGTELYDALTFALSQLATEGKRRKAIVVLTDGVDSKASRFDRAATATATTNEAAIALINPEASPLLNGVLDTADRQGVTIYPLALPDGTQKMQTTLTPQQTALYTSARVRLEAIARRTGGRLHDIRRLEDMGRLYAEVAADMRALYSITYQASGNRKRDGAWRTIRVEVARPDLIARTRPGYYAR